MMRRRALLPAVLWVLLACGCAGTTGAPDVVPERPVVSDMSDAFGAPDAFGSGASNSAAYAADIRFMRSPRFFGRDDAPHTLLLYTNPQCPPCRVFWKEFPKLLRRLDPARVKVIVLGRGFSDEGTRLMFAAAALAAQRPDAATDMLSAASEAGAAAYTQGWVWVEDWIARSAPDCDMERFRKLAGSVDAADAYLNGVDGVRQAHGLNATPTLVIDGWIYGGPLTARGVLDALAP